MVPADHDLPLGGDADQLSSAARPDEPPGPPLLPPEEQLRRLGWPPNAPWMQALTIDPFGPDGRGAICVTQNAAPPYTTEWAAGRAWAGYHLYQLALIAPGTTARVATHWVYLRLWLPGRSWYGVMEQYRGQRPEQSLRGPDLAVLSREQRRLLSVLRDLAIRERGAPPGAREFPTRASFTRALRDQLYAHAYAAAAHPHDHSERYWVDHWLNCSYPTYKAARDRYSLDREQICRGYERYREKRRQEGI
jgi:hypothetical protein